ncbi:MAG: ion transporter [Paludibacteraceae bacterium]|nr:ion transporter [Paludibacteraceae bacterium]
MKKLLLNEKVIFCVIIVNAVCIFLQESGVTNTWIDIIDVLCTFIFMAEMYCKQRELGIKGYWSDGWNRLDGMLVIISIPSVIALFVPDVWLSDLSVLLVLRVLRIFRFFRMVRIFPDFKKIATNSGVAIRQCYAIFIGFFILIVAFALIGCALFGGKAPEYFGTPVEAIYSTFRLFTIEGWYDIPDAVAASSSPLWAHLARIYFCFLLILGGIIGMSLINSIFVDAMVSDNNDDVKRQLTEMEKTLQEIKDKLNEIPL